MSAAPEVKIEPAGLSDRDLAATIVREALLDLGEVAHQLAEPTDNTARVLERLSEEMAGAAKLVRTEQPARPRCVVAWGRLLLFSANIAGHVAFTCNQIEGAVSAFESRAVRAGLSATK